MFSTRLLFAPFTILWQLHTNVYFYKFIVNASRRTLVILITTYYAIFALLSTFSFLLRTAPQWQEKGFSAWQELKAAWPENTELSYRDGTLEVTPEQVYQLTYPQALPRPEGFPAHLGTIDTSLEQPKEKNDTLFFLTSKNLTISQDGTTRTTPLSELFPSESLTLNRENLDAQDENIHTFLALSLQLLAPLVFLSALSLLPLLRVLLLIPFAWMSQSLLHLTGNHLNYHRSFKLGIALLPVAETTQFLLAHLYPQMNIHAFWWIWLLLLCCVSLMNRNKL